MSQKGAKILKPKDSGINEEQDMFLSYINKKSKK